MRRIVVVVLCFFLFLASGVSAQETRLPADVSAFADQTVNFIIETLASAPRGSRVMIEPFSTTGIVSPLGELLAVSISTRLANDGPTRLTVVDLPALMISEDQPPSVDYAVRGRLFQAEASIIIVLQVVELETSNVVREIETGFGTSPWVEELLFIAGPAIGGFSDSYEPDSLSDAYHLIPGESVENRSLTEGDEDWYVFEANDIDGQLFFTAGTSGAIDTYIEVFGPDDPYALLAENDDASDSNAEATVIVEPGQIVWIMVRGYDSTTVGTYSFYSFVESFAGDPLEPNDSPEEAIPLRVNSADTDSMIMPGTDEDWYYFDFQAPRGDDNVISAYTVGDLDTYIELYNENIELLMENDDGGDGRNGRIDMFVSESGRFYLKVRHYDGSDQGNYGVNVQLLQASPDEWEPDNSEREAQSIRVDGNRQIRNFTPADEEDWVTFNLQATSTVEIRTTGDIDTYLVLYDRLGNVVAEDDDSGGDYNASIEQVLQRGTYTVRVSQVEGDSVFGGEYGLSV
ncbi:MAG: pre-peptidase C-terminal domain-containing protein [Dehalococcoidia bacterium]|nr:pre-peptidase C-terminal domain-containing protein [Dehalococcoidia bacterium]